MTRDPDRPERDWLVHDLVIDSPVLGQSWRVLVQAPSGSPPHRLPWIWLLHGSTASADEVGPVLTAAAEAMSSGDIAPMIIAVPDAPEGYRSSWWVDSSYAPSEPQPQPHVVGGFIASPGRPLERALLEDLLPAAETRFGPRPGAAQRTIGGISMGGAAALRWLIVRPDLFGSAVLLSPAAYDPWPSLDSSARATGAFGVGDEIFEPSRFGELMHYPTLLADRPAGPTTARVVIIVGDEEPVQSSEAAGGDLASRCDLDLQAARLHATLKERPDFRSSLRVVGGGHDWPVWQRGIVTALGILAGRELVT
ncbi:MAG: esterase family protein [Actinomycetota bacterium]|nr:esterase family protein [Actinomycetota bacterium]